VVLELTGRYGADLVIDLVGIMEPNWRCIARGGRHCLIGFASGIEMEQTPQRIDAAIYGNFSLTGVLLGYLDGRPSRSAGTPVTASSPAQRATKSMPGFSNFMQREESGLSSARLSRSARFRKHWRPWKSGERAEGS
jgi:NADPH:quinone reductase-like Zn-dependent oxidoreductase